MIAYQYNSRLKPWHCIWNLL